MNKKTQRDADLSKRTLILGAVSLAVAAPLSVVFAAAPTAKLKPLDANLPQAKALKYTVSAAKAGMPKGKDCAGCKLFLAGNSGCSIFPGYSVAADGWCAAWVSKTP